MIKRKWLLVMFMLLLMPVGGVGAQSSATYRTERATTASGGLASSTSYSVVSAIGEPATTVASSASYKVAGGVLRLPQQTLPAEHELWLPIIVR